jgi:hypothetical protein
LLSARDIVATDVAGRIYHIAAMLVILRLCLQDTDYIEIAISFSRYKSNKYIKYYLCRILQNMILSFIMKHYMHKKITFLQHSNHIFLNIILCRAGSCNTISAFTLQTLLLCEGANIIYSATKTTAQ